MKKFLLSAIALAALASAPAFAADMPARVVKAPPPPPPVYNWTGWYIGGNAGYAWGSSDISTNTVFDGAGYFAASSVTSINGSGIGSIDPRGFIGGGQVGYNWQTGNIVFGLEADFEYFRQDESRFIGPVVYPCCAPTTYSLAQNIETNWLFTFRPRLGVAANNWLFYVTGGLAVTELKTNFTFTDTFAAAFANGSSSDTKVGWTAGGGVEFGWGPQWTVRLEYLHVRFDDISVTSTNLTTTGASFPINVFTHSADLSSNIVRGAINFRF